MVLTIGVAALLGHAQRYLPLFVDDAYISLRYSKRLLAGRGLTWTDGERVEGYSNFLLVVGAAALGALGIDLVVAVRIILIASATLVLAAVVTRFRPTGVRDALPALAGCLLAAAWVPLPLWSIAGLENALFAGLLAWGVIVASALLAPGAALGGNVVVRASIPFALLCLTRPDGLLLTGIGAIALADQLPGATLRQRAAVLVRFAVVPGVTVLAHLAFRLVYYGDYVPNTAHAKVALTSARLADGLYMLTGALTTAAGLFALAAGAVVVARLAPHRRPRILLLVALLGAWLGYITVIGFNEFLGFRSYVATVPLLVLLAAETVDFMVERGGVWRLAAPIAVAAALAAILVVQEGDREVRLGVGPARRLTGASATIGLTLGRAYAGERPLVAVDAAGAVPYFSDLPALDMLGLTDRHIAHAKPPDFGYSVLFGHELGDGDYVLARAPDLIVAGVLGEAKIWHRGGNRLHSLAAFDEQYRRVRLEATGSGLRFFLFVRHEGRVGVRRTADRIAIPAVLFAGPGTLGKADEDGAIVAKVVAGTVASLQRIPIPAGAWRVEVLAEPAGLLELRRSDDREVMPFVDGVLTLEHDALLDVDVRADSATLELAPIAVQLRRPEP